MEFRGAREEDIARFPAFVFKKAQVDQLPLHGKEEDDLKVMFTLGVFGGVSKSKCTLN